MNIGDNQKNMMMSLPRERKLALLSMETETKSSDPAKCLKYILSVQEADRKVTTFHLTSIESSYICIHLSVLNKKINVNFNYAI